MSKKPWFALNQITSNDAISGLKNNTYVESIDEFTGRWSIPERLNLTSWQILEMAITMSNFYQNKTATAWVTNIQVYMISVPYPVWSFWAFLLCWSEASVRVTRGMPMAASLSSSSPNLISWGTVLLKHCINQTRFLPIFWISIYIKLLTSINLIYFVHD